jgi:8-oxo-dGTP diphosphatase
MTDLVRRGWDIPGGHVEPGEWPEATVRREVYEETGAILGDLEPLGYQAIRILGSVPPGYRYPSPDSYQVFYLAHVVALDAFVPTTEARGRALLPPSLARTTAWAQQNRELYEVALTLATSDG